MELWLNPETAVIDIAEHTASATRVSGKFNLLAS